MQAPKFVRYFLSVNIITLLIIAVLLAFQNCGEFSADSQSASDEDSEKTSDPIADAAPFAFDTTINQITYMSCTIANNRTQPKSTNQFFTFKTGAYDSLVGIKISDDFINYAKGNLTYQRVLDPSSNRYVTASRILPSQYLALLQKSKLNKDAKVQLSVRRSGYLNDTIVTNSGSPAEDVEYDTVLESLTTDKLGGAIVDKNVNQSIPFRFLEGGFGLSNRQFEAAIMIMSGSDAEKGLRDYLLGDFVLALTYTAANQTASSYLARSPHDFDTTLPDKGLTVYGRGYQLRFAQPGTYSSMPARVLDSVQERDLMDNDNSVIGSWTCDAELRFMIVDPVDAHKETESESYCAPLSDAENEIAAETSGGSSEVSRVHKQLTIIRRHLPVEYWYVNFYDQCVVPKTTTNVCYPDRDSKAASEPVVEYDTSQKCDYYKEVKSGTQNVSIYKYCPHYVSICIRNN